MDSPPSSPIPLQCMVYCTDRTAPWTFSMEKTSVLEDWIQRRGSDTIRKMIFSFHVQDRIQYPYGVHTFVLERPSPPRSSLPRSSLPPSSPMSSLAKHSFRVQFYHYYNPLNQRISQSDEQNILDFYTILRWIYNHDLLSNELGRYIVDPFFKTNEEGLLC